jgi:seryl-tRNA synthetase
MSNVVVVDGVMDVTIKYSANECLELSKELAGKTEKMTVLREELSAKCKEIKAEIRAIENEIASDIKTLNQGFRSIPAAKVKAELDKGNKIVTIKHGDQVVSREKFADKHKALFGEITAAAMNNE